MNLLVRSNLALTTTFALAAIGVGFSCYAMLQETRSARRCVSRPDPRPVP